MLSIIFHLALSLFFDFLHHFFFKMLSANQIAGFLDHLYLWNCSLFKSTKFISRTNQWNSLMFCMLIWIQFNSSTLDNLHLLLTDWLISNNLFLRTFSLGNFFTGFFLLALTKFLTPLIFWVFLFVVLFCFYLTDLVPWIISLILSWLFFSFLYLYLISGSSQKKLVSFPPSVLPLSKHFLEIRYFFFLNFGMMLRTHTKLCLTELHFFGTIFSRKNWKNWPKIGFLWIYWTIYSICSVMKTQTIFLPGY